MRWWFACFLWAGHWSAGWPASGKPASRIMNIYSMSKIWICRFTGTTVARYQAITKMPGCEWWKKYENPAIRGTPNYLNSWKWDYLLAGLRIFPLFADRCRPVVFWNTMVTLHLWPLYSGCQKNVSVFKRFFLQPLIPQFRVPEHDYGKRCNLDSPIAANRVIQWQSS